MSRRKIPLADDTRRRVGEPKSGCRCRNHMGGPKQQHKTRDAALEFAISHTAWTGQARIYPCPTSDRWHVSTRRSE